MSRCEWAGTPLSIAYHDAEWGVPLHDERGLFEFRVLEGAQTLAPLLGGASPLLPLDLVVEVLG